MKQKQLFVTVIFLSVIVTAEGQNFMNLDFSQKCDSSKTGLCHWDLSWGDKNSISPTLLESKNSIFIKGKSVNSVGFVEQSTSLFKINDVQIISI